jgi:hypothetical protein
LRSKGEFQVHKWQVKLFREFREATQLVKVGLPMLKQGLRLAGKPPLLVKLPIWQVGLPTQLKRPIRVPPFTQPGLAKLPTNTLMFPNQILRLVNRGCVGNQAHPMQQREERMKIFPILKEMQVKKDDPSHFIQKIISSGAFNNNSWNLFSPNYLGMVCGVKIISIGP